MKKAIVLMAILCLSAILCVGAFAEDAEDSEEALRWLLAEECGEQECAGFAYGDYDGDGISEAFVLVGGKQEEMGGTKGNLWFVSPLFVEKIQSGKTYIEMEQIGGAAPMLFKAEENYGGSSSTSYLWRVINGAPVEMNASLLENFSYAGFDYDFYSYPSAFDACDDGTGHTWKKYYFYLDLDSMQIQEYGGIYIERSELEQYAGAVELLQNAEAEGLSIEEIIYRANGLFHVNLHSGDGYNYFLTLEIDGNVVTDITEMGENQGYYLLASNPDKAIYPKGIELTRSSKYKEKIETLPVSEQNKKNPIVSLVSEQGDIYYCDLDEDGFNEQFQIVSEIRDDQISYWINVLIGDENGASISKFPIYESATFTQREIRLYNVNGNLYVEASESFEGTSVNFMLFGFDDGKLALKKHLRDPGYSDGMAIIDEVSGEYIYETDENGGYADMISTLETAFMECDLQFKERVGEFSVTAVLPEDEQIGVLKLASGEDESSTQAEEKPQVEYRVEMQNVTGGFTVTGDVNMRDKPNLSGEVITSIKNGAGGQYLGESAEDSRGVTWYYVRYEEKTGWVSSKYTIIN